MRVTPAEYCEEMGRSVSSCKESNEGFEGLDEESSEGLDKESSGGLDKGSGGGLEGLDEESSEGLGKESSEGLDKGSGEGSDKESSEVLDVSVSSCAWSCPFPVSHTQTRALK